MRRVVRTTKAKRISIKLHDVAAFRIRARHGIARSFWFWNFQHRTTHLALHFDGLWAGWFGCITQGSSNVGRPTERIGVLVRGSVHFRLLQGQSHLSLALSFFLSGGFCSHGTQGFAGRGCIQSLRLVWHVCGIKKVRRMMNSGNSLIQRSLRQILRGAAADRD